MNQLRKRCDAEGRQYSIRGEADADPRKVVYWLYRTAAKTVLYSMSYEVSNDFTNCVSKVKVVRRAQDYGAGRRWPAPFSGGGVGNSIFPYVSYQKKIIAGVRAKCIVAGNGFQGFTRCASIEPGLSKGLVLFAEDESDDFQGSGPSQLDEILPNALINSALLDTPSDWRASSR